MTGVKLLILSAKVGNGHVSAAAAIEAEAQRRGVPVCHREMLEITPKPFRRWYAGGYEALVRKGPSVWGHLYRVSDRPRLAFQFQTLLDAAFCRRIRPVLADLRPEWVVCTHSLPQPALARLRPIYGFKMAVVVTDLHPHLMWLRGSPDRYFVPTELTARLLEARQPQAQGRIVLSGMPVHAAFPESVRPFRLLCPAGSTLRCDRPAAEEPTILVSSGGIGGGPVVQAVLELAKVGAKVVVVAGRNERLEQKLESLELPPNVQVLGHIPLEEMARTMSEASLLVGKPGGLTMFEAMACGLPMLIYEPLVIPGQEEDNARFMVEAGAAVVVRSVAQLRSTAARLLGDRPALAEMGRAALANAKPDAAACIVESLGSPSLGGREI